MRLETTDYFTPIQNIEQKRGFFKRVNWFTFDLKNVSLQGDWLFEFAFPLIHVLEIYTVENGNVVPFYIGGANEPFHERPINYRNFIFILHIEPDETKRFYIKAFGSGDLHPPINIWNKEKFLEKSQREYLLLGSFYGVIIVMIFYNLFLFFSLRIKSYLFYVLVITFSLLGKL